MIDVSDKFVEKIALTTRNVSDKFVERNRYIFCVQKLFFSENHAVYETMCGRARQCMIEPDNA
jgi:hypothetical protein